MYSRNMRKGGDGLSEEEREIAKYGLPPKYDGNRFRRPPRDETSGAEGGEDRYPPDGGDGYPRSVRPSRGEHQAPDREVDGSPRRDGDGGKIERLIEGLGERLGTEELLIIALILILAGSGGGECEDAGDVILLLALLLILG